MIKISMQAAKEQNYVWTKLQYKILLNVKRQTLFLIGIIKEIR